jgi:hypothetical protein
MHHIGKRCFLRRKALYIFGGTVVLFLSIVILLYNPLRSLRSFRKAEGHPLYLMTYYGGYDFLSPFILHTDKDMKKYSKHTALNDRYGILESQACTLFAAVGGEQKIYGRNRDLKLKSIALLLFTDPPDGYASVSLVDMSQLGSVPDNHSHSLSFRKQLRLLVTPLLPTEGMNEHGLTIAKADAPRDNPPYDPSKKSLFFRTTIRRVLDHAKTTQEAIELLGKYNISFGPPRGGHFLIADPSGDSAVVEFHNGRMHVIRNETSWQVMTNFYIAGKTEEAREKICSRYRKANKALRKTKGTLSAEQAMNVLKQVSVPLTRWSVAFNMTTGDVSIAFYRQYNNVYHLNFNTLCRQKIEGKCPSYGFFFI